jgi:rubredoxin
VNIVCQRCGGTEFYDLNGRRYCKYCRSEIEGGSRSIFEPRHSGSSTVELNEDIKRLLAKCRKDPVHAKRYASLVLDMDPFNAEARRYL